MKNLKNAIKSSRFAVRDNRLRNVCYVTTLSECTKLLMSLKALIITSVRYLQAVQ